MAAAYSRIAVSDIIAGPGGLYGTLCARLQVQVKFTVYMFIFMTRRGST